MSRYRHEEKEADMSTKVAGLWELVKAGEELDLSIGSGQVRELDYRRGHGIEVALFWEPQTDRVLVAVRDEGTNELLRFPVDRAEALDAFQHPYAHLPRLAA
jgi:hypothetical protein